MDIKSKQQCLCTEPLCAKCLSVNCQDKECHIHTIKAKNKYRKMKMTYIKSETSNEDKVNKAFDILFDAVSEQKKKKEK